LEVINKVYTKFSLVYELSQGKDFEQAKHLAYVAIRNSLGVLIFFSILFIHSSIDLFLFDISFDRSNTPILLIYLGFAIFVIGYLFLAKKYLKPRLKLIPQIYFKENLKDFKRFYVIFIILLSLFGGFSFVGMRLLYIYST